MINTIWFYMIFLSVIFSFITGSFTEITPAFLNGCEDSVTFCLTFLGVSSLWLGVLETAKKSGIIDKMSRILIPVIKFLFKNASDDKRVVEAITMNISANILGLGNAATPFGIKAIEYMQENAKDKYTATDDMITFLLLNTTCIQLLPATMISLRITYGSLNPEIIFFPVFLSTVLSTIAGITISKLFIRFSEK